MTSNMFLDLTMIDWDTSKDKNAAQPNTVNACHLNFKSVVKDFTHLSSKQGFELSGNSYLNSIFLKKAK